MGPGIRVDSAAKADRDGAGATASADQTAPEPATA
jgi:hypothetical protein